MRKQLSQALILTCLLVATAYTGVSQNGLQIKRWPNGKEKSRGEHVKGKKEGLWKFYYIDGTLKLEENYKGGTLHGKWASYDSKGRAIQSGTYDAGEQDGAWKFYTDGRLDSTGTFTKGVRTGLWEVFNEDKKLISSINYTAEGTPNGKYITYYSQKSKTNPKELQVREEGMYANGKKVGIWKEYWVNGLVRFEGAYTDAGEPTGKHIWYTESGKVKDKEKYK